MKRGFADLLEARHDVTGDGADQRRDIIHETLREAVLPGRLQSLGEIQVVDDALHLRWKTGVKLVVTGTKKAQTLVFFFSGLEQSPTMSSKKNQACCRAPSLTLPLLTTH